METRTHRATGEALLVPGKKGPEASKPYNRKPGNGRKGERESEGIVVARRALKDEVVKGPYY